MFHVEPSFYATWQRYQRCLKQRNQALRLGSSDRAISAWDEELSLAAEAVTAMRKAHAAALSSVAADWVAELLDIAVKTFGDPVRARLKDGGNLPRIVPDLATTLAAFVGILRTSSQLGFEVTVVDDGSTDATVAVARADAA